jgi:hypothetical protein
MDIQGNAIPSQLRSKSQHTLEDSGELSMWLQYSGSVASILGLLISVYVLWREYVIEKDVTALKNEEEAWHKEHSGK